MAVDTASYAVLVVEDNPDIVVSLEDLLVHDGYAVHSATSCTQALAHLHAHRFNAVLLDVTLPDGDGLALLGTIQQLDPHLPVIIVTASTATEKTVGSLSRGAYAYLTKPYHREELRQTLRRAIGVKELAVKAQQAQHLLTESENRFRSLVESASDAIVVADGRGIIVSHNRSAATMFGYSDDDLLGQPITILMPVRFRDRHLAGLARVEATGASRLIGSAVELHGLKKDGTEFSIELSLATWKTATGNYYSGIIRDISQRKQIEETLRRSERLLKDIIDNTTAVIYVKGADGRFILTNRRFQELFNLTAGQIAGRTNHDLFPREIAEAFSANDLQVLERAVPAEYDETALHPDGLHHYISIKFPLCDETGAPYAVCGISTDITERKRIGDHLRTNEERIQHALGSARIGIWDWNLLTDRCYWSPIVHDLLGNPAGSGLISRQDFLARIHPDDRPSILAALRLADGSSQGEIAFEHRVRQPDGTLRWLAWSGHIIHDETGRTSRIVGTVQARTPPGR